MRRNKILVYIVLFSLSSSSFAFNGFFVEGSFQRYITVSELEQYTIPKPGWRAGLGYEFLFGRPHSFEVSLGTGHSVIAGSNPVVRTLDIYPLVMGIGWNYTPPRAYKNLLSVGVDLGGGIYFSSVSHYQTLADLITGNLVASKGISAIMFANAFAGLNLLDKSVQLRLDAGLDCIWEEEGLIPIPALSLSVRFYPLAVVSAIRKLQFAEEKPKEVIVYQEVEKTVEKEVIVEVVKEIEKEVIKEIVVEVEPELPPPPPPEPLSPVLQAFLDRNHLTLKFGVAEDSLSQEAAYILDEIGKYLEKHPEETVLVEGHAAPFDTERLQYVMGLRRAEFIRSYLHTNYNIAGKRVVCESRGASQSEGIIPEATNEYYAQYRKAVILRVLPESENQEAAAEGIEAGPLEEADEDRGSVPGGSSGGSPADETAPDIPSEETQEETE